MTDLWKVKDEKECEKAKPSRIWNEDDEETESAQEVEEDEEELAKEEMERMLDEDIETREGMHMSNPSLIF